MQKAKLLPIILLLTTILYLGCKKETGPAGPAGATGSANVMYSAWTPLSMRFSTVDSVYEQPITADSISQKVLDNGLILTYLKFIDASTQATQVVNASAYFQEVFTVKKISLFSGINFTGINYRYLIIPGGVKLQKITAGAFSGMTTLELQKMKYEDVLKTLQKN